MGCTVNTQWRKGPRCLGRYFQRIADSNVRVVVRLIAQKYLADLSIGARFITIGRDVIYCAASMKRTLTSKREFRCRDSHCFFSFFFFFSSLPPSLDYNELPVDVARGRVAEKEIYVGEKMKSTGRRETTYALSRALLSFISVPLCIRPLSHGWYAPPASPKSSFSSCPEILLIFPPPHPPPSPPPLPPPLSRFTS